MSVFTKISRPIVATLVWSICASSVDAQAKGRKMRPEDYWSDPKVIALANAIYREDLDAIDACVRDGVDPNAPRVESKKIPFDMLPLAWAMYHEKKAAFKRLLELGADPMRKFSSYPSLLNALAADGRDSDWLRMALEHGADPNLGGRAANTPIFEAIFSGRRENLELLIAAGADVNQRRRFPADDDSDDFDDTPLLWAAVLNQFELVDYLLEIGADYRLRNDGFDEGSDLAYKVIDSGVTPESESGRWREKVVDWLASAGVDLRDAERRIARQLQFNGIDPIRNQKVETWWRGVQKARVHRWLKIDPRDARDFRLRGSGYMHSGRFDDAISDLTRACELEPRNPANYVMRARAWHRKGLATDKRDEAYGRAITDYSAAIKINSKYAEAHAERADVHGQLAQYREAVADYTTAIELDRGQPTTAAWLWRRAEARHGLFAASNDRNDLNRALADCDESLALVGRDPRAHRARGDILAALDEIDEAIAAYSEAIDLHWNCAAAYAGRARCWAAKGDDARAEANQKEANAYEIRYADWLDVWEFQPVIDDLTRIVRDEPENAGAWTDFAQLLAACPDADFRDGAKALEYATRACELTQWNDAKAITALAEAHVELKNFDEAIKWMERAIERQPEKTKKKELLDRKRRIVSTWEGWEEPSEDPKEKLRERLVKLKFEKALFEADESIRAHPNEAEHYVDRAGVRWTFARDSRDDDELVRGIEDCNRAIELDPGYARAYFMRGKCRAGDLESKIADYSEAIRLYPKYAAAYCARAEAFMSNAMLTGVFSSKELATQQYGAAISDLTAAVSLDPEFDWAWYQRGNAWTKKGEHAKAAEDYTRAIGIDPKYRPYYVSRASAWVAVGEDDKAIADCDFALSLKPGEEDALAVRGEAWFAKKEYDRALADFEAAGKSKRRRAVLKAAGKYQSLLDDLLADIRKYPESFKTHEGLALLFAACPDAKFRDGEKALEYARKACELTGWTDSASLAAIAAACAEKGDFEGAIKWQTKAVEAAGEDAPREEYRRRLALYKRGEPFRETLEALAGGDNKRTTPKAAD